MNEPLNPDDAAVDLNEAVMESAAQPVDPLAPPVAAMEWGGPVGSVGSRADVPPESNTQSIEQQLVQAGNEEAGREQRLAADARFPTA